MSGAYRRVVQQPQDLEWTLIEYDDSNADLAVTELTALRQTQSLDSEEETAKGAHVVVLTPEQLAAEGETNTRPESRFTALQLKFTLPPGTYATMLLRELTKESTETQFQAQLSSTADSKPYTSNNLTNTNSSSKGVKRNAGEVIGSGEKAVEFLNKVAKVDEENVTAV
jgi:hypothetical protein